MKFEAMVRAEMRQATGRARAMVTPVRHGPPSASILEVAATSRSVNVSEFVGVINRILAGYPG